MVITRIDDSCWFSEDRERLLGMRVAESGRDPNDGLHYFKLYTDECVAAGFTSSFLPGIVATALYREAKTTGRLWYSGKTVTLSPPDALASFLDLLASPLATEE